MTNNRIWFLSETLAFALFVVAESAIVSTPAVPHAHSQPKVYAWGVYQPVQKEEYCTQQFPDGRVQTMPGHIACKEYQPEVCY